MKNEQCFTSDADNFNLTNTVKLFLSNFASFIFTPKFLFKCGTYCKSRGKEQTCRQTAVTGSSWKIV